MVTFQFYPTDVFPSIVLFFTAFVVSKILVSLNIISMPSDRLNTIDGLRGYLSFSVFIHHSLIWFFYLRTGIWQLPPSRFYSQIGQVSVALFFMITAFLFWGKLLRSRGKDFEWDRFFLSRIARLAPLYMFVIFVMFVVVAFLSNFEIRDSFINITISGIRWLGFQVLGKPDINHVINTFTIVAGATWTLPFEWFFYFSLPVLALVFLSNVRALIVVLCIVVLCIFLWSNIKIYLLLPFLFGMLSAFLFNIKFKVSSFKGIGGSIIALTCLVIVVFCFDSPYQLLPIALLFVAFYSIVCGASLFGVLENSASRFLGDISYSIYLLHGIFLFLYFNFIGTDFSGVSSSANSHWFGVIALVPFIIVFSCFSYKYIELPAINSVDKLVCIFRKSKFYRAM